MWLAGFSAKRPAKGVNDPIWARSLALRHQGKTLVLVSIDCIGLTYERFVKIRKSIDHTKYGIDHIIFSSTHTHNGPDVLGIWSYHRLPVKRDEAYIETVLAKTKDAILDSVEALEPADGFYASTEIEPEGWVRDSRPPLVYDRVLGVMRFNKAGSAGETIQPY